MLDSSVVCESVNGKYQFPKNVEMHLEKKILLIFDDFYFGDVVDDLNPYLSDNDIHFFNPNSFEYLLLESMLFQNDEIVQNELQKFKANVYWNLTV
jgi:hypothetical protein